MVPGPVEVVYQVRLPEGPLARATKRESTLRILATPIGSQPAPHPTRYLFSAYGPALDHDAVHDALAPFLDEVALVRRTIDALDLVGTLNEATRHAIEGTLGEATMILGNDIIHRPALLRDGWLHASIVVVHDQPVEEAIARFSSMLQQRGIEGRISRLGPALTERWPIGSYEETLTPKQTEMLRMALALGLYDTPRRCTLDTLAEIFGISKAAAHNRMKGAERKILARYFE